MPSDCQSYVHGRVPRHGPNQPLRYVLQRRLLAWEFAAHLEAGRNTLVAPVPQYAERLWKGVHTVQIYMVHPQDGEAVFVENLRLSTDVAPAVSPFSSEPLVPPGKYTVSGTDMKVKNVDKLADNLKDQRTEPEDQTVEQVEADVRAQYDRLKKEHPKAVLVMLRDGQPGHDPARSDKPFAGWQDAGTPSHLPMALTLMNFSNSGTRADRNLLPTPPRLPASICRASRGRPAF